MYDFAGVNHYLALFALAWIGIYFGWPLLCFLGNTLANAIFRQPEYNPRHSYRSKDEAY